MWRTLLCLSLAVAFSSVGLAEDKKNDKGKYMRGQIVRVNPTGNTVVIRTGTGTEAKEQEMKVSNTTKLFGSDKQPLTDGLKSKNFKEGTEVWFMPDATDKTSITELRFYDPSQP